MTDNDRSTFNDAITRADQSSDQATSEILGRETLGKDAETLALWRASSRAGNLPGLITEGEFGLTDTTKAQDMYLAQDDSKTKKNDRPVQKADKAVFPKLTDKEKESAAKELAQLCSTKGFTDEVKKQTRNLVSQVLMDGDPSGPGNPKLLKDFLKKIDEEMVKAKPDGPRLVLNQVDQEFLKRAEKAIENRPDAQLGFSGKLEIKKDGKVTSYMNFVQPVRKQKIITT